MRIPALAATAAVLVLGLAACTGATTTPTDQQTPGATAETSSPAMTVSPSAAPTQTPTAVTSRGGQASPDAAGQAFLRAFGTGDAQGVCAVMATQDQPMADNQAAIEQCASMIQGTMDLAKEQASQLADATVSGATVSGNLATFENATITPELGRNLLESQSAVQIDGRWYIRM